MPLQLFNGLEAQKGSDWRLRGLAMPQYRLRVGEIRVFYDVTEKVVEVLAIVPKSMAAAWLEQKGEPR